VNFQNSHPLPLLAGFMNSEALKGKTWFQLERDTSLTWEFVKWLKGQTKLKVVLKGLLHAEDAVLAARHGADAVWLSNHGGRQLDTSVAPASTLKACRRALDQAGLKLPLFVDGGVRKGSDILKCLALGADFVFVGRPIIYGLALGQPGLDKAVQILKA
jgi:isopentenyl diphosphate isomerase/L-lactate dehydrogenase-like FMN-dependent dehydrogenase